MTPSGRDGCPRALADVAGVVGKQLGVRRKCRGFRACLNALRKDQDLIGEPSQKTGFC